MRADAYHDVTLARYEREQDRFAREENWINDRAEALLDSDFAAEKPEVFLDMLSEAGDDLIKELRPFLKQTPWNTAAIGNILCSWVEERCWEEACQRAADELEELQ